MSNFGELSVSIGIGGQRGAPSSGRTKTRQYKADEEAAAATTDNPGSPRQSFRSGGGGT